MLLSATVTRNKLKVLMSNDKSRPHTYARTSSDIYVELCEVDNDSSNSTRLVIRSDENNDRLGIQAGQKHLHASSGSGNEILKRSFTVNDFHCAKA